MSAIPVTSVADHAQWFNGANRNEVNDRSGVEFGGRGPVARGACPVNEMLKPARP